MDEQQRKALMNSFLSDKDKEAAALKAKREAAEAALAQKNEDKEAVAAGITRVVMAEASQKAKERKIQKEGLPNLGRSAEDIVLGKRTVFDNDIGSRK